MKKLHIINLGKMGGVERLFLQYINDTHDGSNQVICVSSEVGEEIRQQMPNQQVTFANRLFNSLLCVAHSFCANTCCKEKSSEQTPTSLSCGI